MTTHEIWPKGLAKLLEANFASAHVSIFDDRIGPQGLPLFFAELGLESCHLIVQGWLRELPNQQHYLLQTALKL